MFEFLFFFIWVWLGWGVYHSVILLQYDLKRAQQEQLQIIDYLRYVNEEPDFIPDYEVLFSTVCQHVHIVCCGPFRYRS